MKAPDKPLRKVDIAATLNFQSRNPVELAHNRATPIQRERAEQRALVQWVNLQPWAHAFVHWPNERVNQREAQRLKAEGVKRGPPDNWLFLKSGPWAGAVSELKRPGVTRSAVSDEQRWWLLHLESQGWCVGAHRGWDQSREFFNGYLDGHGWSLRDDWWR